MDIGKILTNFDDILYTWLLIYMLAGAGIYFTIKTRFVQIRLFKDAIIAMTEKKSHEKGVSSFQALMIATASRVGTGNMAGVATAIISGGPGAAFWMWLMAILGSASAFIESTLAQIYKKKEGHSFKGGPAYYIEKALHARWLGIVFAISLILTFAFGFNGLQAYNIVSALDYYIPDISASNVPTIVGVILCVVSMALFFGGTDKISKLSEILVPFMAIIYIAIGLFCIVTHITAIPSILVMIVKDAFNLKAIFGAFTGSCMVYGIKRGLFSNEAGMGSAPNASASAQVSHPAKQGLAPCPGNLGVHRYLAHLLDNRIRCAAYRGIHGIAIRWNPLDPTLCRNNPRSHRHPHHHHFCYSFCLYLDYRQLFLRRKQHPVHHAKQNRHECIPRLGRLDGIHRGA